MRNAYFGSIFGKNIWCFYENISNTTKLKQTKTLTMERLLKISEVIVKNDYDSAECHNLESHLLGNVKYGPEYVYENQKKNVFFYVCVKFILFVTPTHAPFMNTLTFPKTSFGFTFSASKHIICGKMNSYNELLFVGIVICAI